MLRASRQRNKPFLRRQDCSKIHAYKAPSKRKGRVYILQKINSKPNLTPDTRVDEMIILFPLIFVDGHGNRDSS